MENSIIKLALFLLLLPLFIASCEKVEFTNSTPSSSEKSEWKVDDILGYWSSDCINKADDDRTSRIFMTFETNSYRFQECLYFSPSNCQSKINGTATEQEVIAFERYREELRSESASYGKEITTNKGYYFFGKTGDFHEALFWGSATNKNTMLLLNLGPTGIFNEGSIDYDLLNEMNYPFLYTDLSLVNQSNLSSSLIYLNRASSNSGINDWGCTPLNIQ